jgi:hypothetical protein
MLDSAVMCCSARKSFGLSRDARLGLLALLLRR